MANIIGLHGSDVVRGRVARALAIDRSSSVDHRLVWVPNRATLVRSLRGDPDQVVILDAYLNGELQLALIEWLADYGTLSGLILYSDLRGRPGRDLLRLANSGVRWLLTKDVDDTPLALRRMIALATYDQPSQRFLQNVRDILDPHAYKAFQFVYSRSVRPISVADVAAGLGCGQRQLYRIHDRGNLPAPGRLIQWCRVLHAIRLLSDSHRSSSQVAHILGFSDPSNMRRLIRSVTGLSTAELLSNGGIVPVQSALLTYISPLPRHNLGTQRVS